MSSRLLPTATLSLCKSPWTVTLWRRASGGSSTTRAHDSVMQERRTCWFRGGVQRFMAIASTGEDTVMEANATVISNSQGCLENNHSHPVPVTSGTRVHILDWMVDVAQGQWSLCEL